MTTLDSTNPIACARGCLRWGRHATDCGHRDEHLPGCVDDNCEQCNPDWCAGCQPREAKVGLLCATCAARLEQLLAGPDDRESIAGVCEWLADNLGQHLRSTPMGGTSRSANPGEGFVSVMAALRDLQIGYAEFATDFLTTRSMRPLQDTHPAHIATRLRPWLSTIAAWEPIADTLDQLIEWRGQAHGVCPWRGVDPAATVEAAVMLHLAPAEPTDQICTRFGVTDVWLRQRKARGDIQPIEAGVRPLWWRPWDVFSLLHPDAAKRYEDSLADTATLAGREVVYRTG